MLKEKKGRTAPDLGDMKIKEILINGEYKKVAVVVLPKGKKKKRQK